MPSTKKSLLFLWLNPKLAVYLQTQAQMAESVDALVSNTSGAIHPGSSPGLGTKAVEKRCGSLVK